MELLAWIAEREDDYPGAWLDGSSLMQQTAGMAGGDGLPWEAVARAAATLRKRGYLDWDYDKWPNELQEPPPQQLDYMTFQRTKNITVSGAGYQALEARKAKSAATQINIINSTVGQVALRDVNNIDVFVILRPPSRRSRRSTPLPSQRGGARRDPPDAGRRRICPFLDRQRGACSCGPPGSRLAVVPSGGRPTRHPWRLELLGMHCASPGPHSQSVPAPYGMAGWSLGRSPLAARQLGVGLLRWTTVLLVSKWATAGPLDDCFSPMPRCPVVATALGGNQSPLQRPRATDHGLMRGPRPALLPNSSRPVAPCSSGWERT